MKCLRKYEWVKLPRDYPYMGKGLMASWARLASRAAFRKGNARYCGHTNPVTPGMWSGGVVGLKSILGAKSRPTALQTLDELASLGFLKYTLDRKTKHLTYEISNWVVKCSGAECLTGAVYATEGYGFLCLPRNITQRLVDADKEFDESSAWLDLWCHTAFEDYGNAFSFLAPAVQFGKYGSVLTLETLGQRWNWEKTRVWRFFRNHSDVFSLYRLPSSYGCVVFNALYPTGGEVQLPEKDLVVSILNEILISTKYKYNGNSENMKVNHIYDRNEPERQFRDHDNIELNFVTDTVALFVMTDDAPLRCRHYYCSAAGQAERTEVYVVPAKDFIKWYEAEQTFPEEGVKLHAQNTFWQEKDVPKQG